MHWLKTVFGLNLFRLREAPGSARLFRGQVQRCGQCLKSLETPCTRPGHHCTDSIP